MPFVYSSEVAQSLQEHFEAIRAISFEKGRGVKNYRNAPRVGTGRDEKRIPFDTPVSELIQLNR